jgi:hypothetical protein
MAYLLLATLRFLYPPPTTLVEDERWCLILPDNRIIDGAVAWEPGAVDVAADGVLLSGRRCRKPGPPADKQAAAARWLLARLSTGPAYIGDASDSVQSQTLRGELKGAGFSYATLRQAFAAAHAVSERCASTGRYRWRLASATEGAERSRVGPGSGGG